jgi:hypothetical protein
VRLDSLDTPAVGFLKVDVEGYELPVLLGGQHLIEKRRPNLFIEVHPVFQKNRRETDEVLRFIAEYYRHVVVWTRRPQSLLSKVLIPYSALSPFRRSPVKSSLAASPDIFWVAARAG